MADNLNANVPSLKKELIVRDHMLTLGRDLQLDDQHYIHEMDIIGARTRRAMDLFLEVGKLGLIERFR